MAFPARDDPWSVADMVGLSGPVDCSKPYDTSTLAGKTILITGGASGFGAAFARHWACHGCHLIIGDVNDRAGEELVAELRASAKSPDQVITYQHCDVTSWADQVALFRTAAASSPTRTIDTVVAGAGIVHKGGSLKSSAGLFDLPQNLDADTLPPPPPLNVLAVNLTGVMYSAHLALFYLPHNKPPFTPTTTTTTTTDPKPEPPQGDRHLLLISSIAGLIPLPGQTEYTTSKHAVMGLFRALRGTAAAPPRGVRVNVLNPYFVATPLLPASGLALLAGQGAAKLEDVVDAATRLVADRGIVGRALLVGPRVRVVDETDEGLQKDGEGVRIVEGEEGRQEGARLQAVWEIYGHDYQRVEVFVWRYLAALNLVRRLRGWVGVVKDLWGLYVTKEGRR